MVTEESVEKLVVVAAPEGEPEGGGATGSLGEQGKAVSLSHGGHQMVGDWGRQDGRGGQITRYCTYACRSCTYEYLTYCTQYLVVVAAHGFVLMKEQEQGGVDEESSFPGVMLPC
jgi:hypothetical protein